jgi:hypothetical protein
VRLVVSLGDPNKSKESAADRALSGEKGTVTIRWSLQRSDQPRSFSIPVD